MKLFLNAIKRELTIKEYFVFGGLALIGYGIAQIYPPAAWIAIGSALFIMGSRS